MTKKTWKYNMYFDKDGTPIKGTLAWAKKFEDRKYSKVNFTKLWWGGHVSTIWLGLNHSFTLSERPLIFESMVFTPWVGRWGRISTDTIRYSTIKEARKGHRELVKKYNNPIRTLPSVWQEITWSYRMWKWGKEE